MADFVVKTTIPVRLDGKYYAADSYHTVDEATAREMVKEHGAILRDPEKFPRMPNKPTMAVEPEATVTVKRRRGTKK